MSYQNAETYEVLLLWRFKKRNDLAAIKICQYFRCEKKRNFCITATFAKILIRPGYDDEERGTTS